MIKAFLDGEVRYLSLKKVCPNEAQELFDAAKKAAQHRYATYVRMSKIARNSRHHGDVATATLPTCA